MFALNQAQIIGHLAQDPEIRQTPSGQSVGDLVVVTTYVFKDKSGQEQTGKSYHNLVAWRGLADVYERGVMYFFQDVFKQILGKMRLVKKNIKLESS